MQLFYSWISLQNKFLAFILISKIFSRVSLNTNNTNIGSDKRIFILTAFLVSLFLTQWLFWRQSVTLLCFYHWVVSPLQMRLLQTGSFVCLPRSCPHWVSFPAGKFYQVMDWRRKWVVRGQIKFIQNEFCSDIKLVLFWFLIIFFPLVWFGWARWSVCLWTQWCLLIILIKLVALRCLVSLPLHIDTFLLR